ncbi:MAG: GGDEF domain-containing protein [Deltaproteobacteria bacterium]|jgi:two-component system cell cycle response regulator
MTTDDPSDGVQADLEKTAIHAIPTLDQKVEPDRSAAMICISGRSIGQMFLLAKRETTIGRAPECEIFLDDEGVSRHHAKVIEQEGQLILMDLGSTNGTYAEGERIQVVTLTDGAKIQVGTATILQFRLQDQREMEFHALMQNFKTHDPMTEAFNKRAFLTEIEKEAGFARRHEQPLSLIMFDLDHFKKVNDTYGHQAGDLVLRSVAQAVQDMMRKEDIFARYGGEEFALLLRNTPLESAFIVAERVRREIEALEVTHDGRRIPCTASVGLAALTASMRRPTDLIEAADQRLYQAKRKGRNRTEAALFD